MSDLGTHRPTFWELVRAVQWMNLLSPRVWTSAVVTGMLAAVVPALLWEPLIMPVFVVVFAFMMFAMLVGPPVRCPHCRSMVKVLASRCRHCGADVS